MPHYNAYDSFKTKKSMEKKKKAKVNSLPMIEFRAFTAVA